MGIETAILIGLTAVKTMSTLKQGRDESKAVVQQANLQTSEKAKETRMRAARAKASFLSSGLTLDGTPAAAIGGLYSSGLADIKQIRSNADAQSKNIMSKARTDAITGLMGSAAMGMSGSMFSGAGASAASFMPDQALYGLNEMGQGSMAWEAFDIKDGRGY